MFWAELVKFWLHPGHHGHLLGNLQMPLSCRVLVSLLIVLELNLLINPIVKAKMVEELSEGRGWLNTQSLKNLLNHNILLDSNQLNSFLSVTKNIDTLHNTKSVGESTSNSCVFENRDVSVFHPETDEIIRNLDLKRLFILLHPRVLPLTTCFRKNWEIRTLLCQMYSMFCLQKRIQWFAMLTKRLTSPLAFSTL